MEIDFCSGLVASLLNCEARFGTSLTNFVSSKPSSFKRTTSSSALWIAFNSESRESN